MFSRARRHENEGDLEAAREAYTSILERRRGDADALLGLGRVFSVAGDQERAAACFERAADRTPDSADVLAHLGENLFLRGRFAEALRIASRAISSECRDARGYSIAARALNQLNRTEEAAQVVEEGLAVAPGDALLRVTAATVMRRCGELKRARRYVEAVVHRRTIPGSVKRAALSEYGFVLDRIGDYTRAFEAFERAGDAYRRSRRGRRLLNHPWRQAIRAMTHGFSRSLLARWESESFDTEAPIFLVGFPRSGTTMTEQILAAHSSMRSIEEKPLVQTLLNRAARMAGVTPNELRTALDRLTRDQIADLRAEYWRLARDQAEEPDGSVRTIDKLPLNILALPAINVIFPDAQVLVALRDPRDVCLSCLMQAFNLNEAMIQFVSLERTTMFYEAVMRAWLGMRECLTVEYLTVRYEDTVDDLEQQSRRMLSFLDADWEHGVLEFHLNARQREIATPSFAAVSRPVHTRAVGRWRNYQEQLARHLDRLLPFVEAFGYSEAD